MANSSFSLRSLGLSTFITLGILSSMEACGDAEGTAPPGPSTNMIGAAGTANDRDGEETTTTSEAQEGNANEMENANLVLIGELLPAQLEAEAFTAAGELDPAQEGADSCVSSIVPGVDIEATTSASGGCSIGYTAAGEWLEYEVATETAAAYDLILSMASLEANRQVSISIDGTLRGTLTTPATDWHDFEEVSLEGLNLSAGSHILRITFETGTSNLDYIRFDFAGACVPQCSGRACGADECGGTCGNCDENENCTSAGTCRGASIPPVEVHGALSVQGGKIIDKNGDPVQLRGISTQWLNWENTFAGVRQNMEYMRDEWGLEVYRIANGVEGSNGYADPAVRSNRLERVKEMIETSLDLGIYVIVDWHTHREGYEDLAKDFFDEISEDYGDKPNIIYETFNEPLDNRSLDERSSADYWSQAVKPYHEAVNATIRANDPDNIIILGTPRWSQDVDIAAANPVSGTNLAYTLHFYSCSHGSWLREKAQDALDDGVALFITEWGSTHADGGTPANAGVCLGETRAWHQWLDARSIGSAAWKLTNDGDSSAILKGGANPRGPWTDQYLSEHGQYVRDLLQSE
ncbi:MAG: cellulase family glycosylhydrolase [Polyangiaceae bacterium]|nr:cellulase family glycosylhydrolase [Polyangiaceae bacterium]